MMKRVLAHCPNERQQGSQRLGRLSLRKSPLLPDLRVLVLDRHSCGEADEAVRVVQIGPGGFTGQGIPLAMERFQPEPQRPGRIGQRMNLLPGRGNLVAYMGDAVKT